MTNKPNLQYGQMFEKDKYVRQRFEIYKKLLTPYLKPDVKILDIGGYQADLLTLLPKDVRYHVADFDKKALEIAKKRGAKIQQINIDQDYKKIFPKEKFDIILLTEVLEHLVDPRSVLIHAKGLLKQGGVILISLPNENTIYHRIMSLLGFGLDSYAFKLYKHLHLPTITQSRIFVSKQLKIEKQVYWYHVGFNTTRTEYLGKITKLLPPVGWKLLANNFPGLFARGVIFLCQKRR